MKKKLLALALAVAMVLSLSTIVNAGPGGGIFDEPGITPGGPRSLSITICLEDN